MAQAAPADMTVDKFLKAFTAYNGVVEAKIAKLFARAAKETAGASPEDKDAYMAVLFRDNEEAIQAAASAEAAIDDAAFKGCMIKFGQDPRVAAIMSASHERQDKLRKKYLAGR